MTRNLGELDALISEGQAEARNPVRLAQRQVSERLMRRAFHLCPEDRALVHGVYRAGLSSVELANLTGCSPQTVRRRLRRLMQHLNSDMFAFILTSRGQWSPPRRKVAQLLYLQRLPLRETVRRSGLSMHTVRKHGAAIAAQFEVLQP